MNAIETWTSGRRFRVWWLVHRWTSLVSGLFLLVLCLTGLPLIFGDEIEGLSRDAPKGAVVARGGASRSLDELVALVREKRPGAFVQFVFFREDDPDALGVGVAPTLRAQSEAVTRFEVDRQSAELRADRDAESRVMRFFLDVHRELLAGAAGRAVLSVVGLLFVLSLVSGVVLYAPFLRPLRFGVLRKERRRLFWLDTHNLVGIATALWAFVVGLTGLLNTLEEPLFGAWQAREVPRLLAPYRDQPALAQASSVDAALATARAALPDMQPASITFPGTEFATPRHYMVWMHGTSTLTSRLFTPVLVDARTGALTSARGLPWYLRLVEVSRPLHFGDYGGLPFKVLWAVFDLLTIVVLGSGGYLWFERTRRSRLPRRAVGLGVAPEVLPP